jgi:hypothetical protein
MDHLLDRWYEYETKAVERNSREWCQRNNIHITETSSLFGSD